MQANTEKANRIAVRAREILTDWSTNPDDGAMVDWETMTVSQLHDVCDPNAAFNDAADDVVPGRDWDDAVLNLAMAVYDDLYALTLFQRAAIIYPHVTMNWAGHDDPDSAVAAIADGNVVITRDYDGGDQYTVGVYPDDDWLDGNDPSVYVVVDTAAHALDILRDLTTLQPEDTYWGAWATQWLSDAVCDNRIAGLTGSGS